MIAWAMGALAPLVGYLVAGLVGLLGLAGAAWGLKRSGKNEQQAQDSAQRAKADGAALGADDGASLSDAELVRRLHVDWERK